MNSHYFIGIPITDEVRGTLTMWQDQLKKHVAYKNWTHPKDFHITLKFLGDCTDETIRKMIYELEKRTWPDPFSVGIGPAGSFGKKAAPRVFHAKVEKHPSLLHLQEETDKIVETLGWDRENRPFIPHITLGKKDVKGTSPLVKIPVDPVFTENYVMTVDCFHMFRIHPGHQPKYEVVCTIPLRSGKE